MGNELTLYPHQAREVENHWAEPARALFWCPRAGKTLAALCSVWRQIQTGKSRGAVVSTPPNVVGYWRTEAEAFGFRVWAWDSRHTDSYMRERLEALLKTSGGPILIVVGSHVWALPRASFVFSLLARTARNWSLIADESHEYASPSSKRGRRIRSWARKCTAFQRLLTGTPVHNRLLDVWGQFEIFGKGTLGFTAFSKFANRYGDYETRHGPHGSYPKLIGYRHTQELREKIDSLSSVLQAKDLDGMRPVERRLVRAHITPSVLNQYRDILDGLITETAAVDLLRMQQIVSADPKRIRKSVERALEADCRAVIWVRFNADIEPLCAEAKRQGVSYVHTFYSKTPNMQRHVVRKCFQWNGEGGLLIAQPTACGVGLDLSAVRAMVWHTPPVDARTAAQALERCTRKGGGTVRASYIMSAGVDVRNLERVLRNSDVARMTLEDDISAVNEYGDLELSGLRAFPDSLKKAIGK